MLLFIYFALLTELWGFDLVKQLQHLQSYASGLISKHWDFNGASLTQGAACATSLYNIDYAIKLLEDDDYDYCVVGAA